MTEDRSKLPISAKELVRAAARTEQPVVDPDSIRASRIDASSLRASTIDSNSIQASTIDAYKMPLDLSLSADRIVATLPRQITTIPRGQNDSASTVVAPIDIGRAIRKLREGRKMSQQEFADLAGVGRRFVSELENGKATLELGKVLQVVHAAGLNLFVQKR